MPWARVSSAPDPNNGHVRENAKAWRRYASRGGKVRDWVTFGAFALAALACLQIYVGHGFGSVGVGVGDRRRNKIIATGVDPSRGPTVKHSYLDRSTLDAHTCNVFKLGALPWQPGASFYQGLPVSDLRPSGQFYVRSDLPSSLKPVITIVTATRNPREIFFSRTVRFVLQQSLQAFRWVVVNDCSDDAGSVVRLEELKRWAAAIEPRRILLLDRPQIDCAALGGRGNGPAAMNYGLRLVDGPFVAILDDDDMWELTTLEKAVLVMSWVPQAYAVSFDVVNHGAKQFLWKRGFHNGDESFFTENNLMQGSPFRSSVLDKCRFREDMADGGADWDLWMCMASHGMWGLHVPEQGNWYQWNPPEFRKKRWRAVTTHAGLKEIRERIQRRYSNLLQQDAWPSMVLPPREEAAGEAGGLRAHSRDDNRDFIYQTPFANRVGNRDLRSVLLVLRDLASSVGLNGDSDVVQYAKGFAEAGWRVTVLMTHYTDDGDNNNDPSRRQALMRYTHDVFVGANIAPLHRLADLAAYLIETRGVEAVLVLPADPSQLQISRRLVSASMCMLVHAHAVAVVDVTKSAAKAFDVIQATKRAVASLAASRPGSIKLVGRPGQTTPTAPSWSAFVQHSLLLPQDKTPTRGLPDDLDRRRIDMRRVQVALQYRKRRNGFGRELQIACPERVYANTRWIDALEHPVACGGVTRVLDVDLLQKSALEQCGAWCIASLGGKGLVGWEFTGSCFRPLGGSPADSDKCHAELARRSPS